MAHKKGAGSTKNGRDSNAKRLGIKSTNGQYAKIGQILLRQRGSVFLAGDNVGIGKDYTLFALKNGIIEYKNAPGNRKKVSVKLSSWDSLIETLGYKNWMEFNNI
jgi:large subunit ribosomal protein L27